MRFLLTLVLLALLAGPVHAVQVMDEPAARAQMFPQATGWELVPAAAITRAQRELGRDPAVTLVAAHFVVHRVMNGEALLGYFVTDQVIGKFEKIDYAAALNAEGVVTSVRILKYRESHGHEVAGLDWLAQFEGGDATAKFKVGRDIDGITGATLSCVHMAEGMRRVTRLVAALRAGGY
jgi:Na+-translocating ferredoxin:NAD+ oxidoreductase RnfG subunit